MATKRNVSDRLASVYQEAYDDLNEAQRQAVDQLDGPIMVLAGPGTGKTQILALRIGHILSKTDTSPGNILCLTYTDAGAIAMRKRLLKYIGPAAYKVQVHTFHSFCNQVIQDNQESFSAYAILQHISDLEKAQMLRSAIDSFPYEHPLRKLKGQLYYEARRMESLFSLMKRESWTPAYLVDHIAAEYQRIEQDPANFYKTTRKTYKAGDPKRDYYKKKDRMDLLKAAVHAFEPFQIRMKEAGRYDFDDMIHWVLEAFQTDDGLLASYQERFLYVLVDEYQDTNGSQNKIIELLVDYWERPNLFVVGDDDQAIFRFQGANMTNLVDLHRKYQPTTVVLTHNYRSSQPILDSAGHLVNFNAQRITHEFPGVQKRLVSRLAHAPKNQSPQVYEYLNVAQEESALFTKLKLLQAQQVPLSQIAVIYRKHAQAYNLIKALAQINVPIDVKQKVNILYEPVIRNLEHILTYLHKESVTPGTAESILFELMHYRFFDLPPVEVAKLSMHCWRNPRDRRSLRQAIKDVDLLESLELQHIPAFLAFSATLDYWVSQIPHVTLQVLFERILKRGNVLREVMKSDRRTYQMQTIATFFNYLKEETHRDPGMQLGAFLQTLAEMREMELPLYMHNLMRSRDGINFMTAHGAKGLEFEYVFMIGCNKRHWESLYGRRDAYTLPSSIIDPTKETDVEDERRLFYVAMTRAKHSLQISYAAENLNGMPEEPSQFIAELLSQGAAGAVEKKVPERETVDFYENLLTPTDRKLPLIDHDLIDRALEKFQMSPTALNKYLACPRTFYFENILKVPLANSPYLGFGNAVHYALQRTLEDHLHGLPLTEERLMQHYESQMLFFRAHFSTKEFENYLKHGERILPAYVAHHRDRWLSAKRLLVEKNISHVTHRGIPIKGRIDLILEDSSGRYTVIDFKTGNMDNPQLRNQKLRAQTSFDRPGGDYWRQVVFYKILLDAQADDPVIMDVGQMSFVEPDKHGQFYDKDFLVDLGQYELVSDQIVSVHQRLHDHDFDVDCGRRDCDWCNFVKNDFVLPEDTFAEAEEPTPREFVSDMGQYELDF